MGTLTAFLGGFFENGMEVLAGKNEIVLAAGETPKGVYWVVSGHIKVTSITGAGEERIHFVAKAGELFPVGWALGGAVVDASYAAMDNTRLRLQSIEKFNEFIGQHPGAIAEVVPQLLAAYARVYNLNLETARERVIHRLLALSERFPDGASYKADDFVVIDLPQTQQEFASSVRLSRETAGKILTTLEAEHAVILGRKVVRVSPEKLNALLDDHKA